MSEVLRSTEAAIHAVTSALAAFSPAESGIAEEPQPMRADAPAPIAKTIDIQNPSIGHGRVVFNPIARAKRREKCTEAILSTEPEEVGLKTPVDIKKEKFGKQQLASLEDLLGRKLGPLSPFVVLSSVEEVDGKPCYEDLVERRMVLAAKINGRWGNQRIPGLGNAGEGLEVTNLGYTRSQVCGELVQAVFKVEADTDGKAGNDPAVVYKSPEVQADCK